MGEDRQDLIRDVGGAVQAYQRSTDAFDDAIARHLDLNRTDLRSLDWLSGGPMTIGHLSVATALSSAATTKLVDRLEHKGFVRRVRDDGDRRRILVEMTPRAGQLVGELYGPLVEEGRELLARYGPAQLAALRDHFVASTELTDRHRRRVAGLGVPDDVSGETGSR
jgi:DNA-binding MarR family transcriptional regulator